MKKKLTIFFLVALTMTFGLFLGPDKAYTDSNITLENPTDELFLPYNIVTPQWRTGIYIVAACGCDMTVRFEFYHGETAIPYATVTKLIEGYTGWTGRINYFMGII